MNLNEIDIDKIRAETPGVMQTCHLLASGSSLMPKPVVDAIINHTLLEASIGGYEAADQQQVMLDAVYRKTADLIGAMPQEIALMENATVAWCHAFYSLPLSKGDRIITCEAEYGANYVAFLQRQKRDGFEIDVVPSDESGSIDLSALKEMIDDRVKLIAITWIPTNGGLVNPAKAVGKIAKQYKIPYLLDACQVVGQMPVDVAELGCVFLTATARKFLRGPRGSGFLYISKERLKVTEPVMIDHFGAPWISRNEYMLRSDARRFETWENSYAIRAGLGAAIDYAESIGLDAIQNRSWGLANYLRDSLNEVPGIKTRDLGREQCAIVSFTFDKRDPASVIKTLQDKNIMIGASSPSSTRLDAEKRNLPIVLRAVPHYYNTTHEIDQLLSALKEL